MNKITSTMQYLYKIALLMVFISSFSYSQDIKVTYQYFPSDYFEGEETIYLNKNYKVSIIDSILIKKQVQNRGEDFNIEKDKGQAPHRRIIIQEIKTKNIQKTFQLKKINYLVSDTPPTLQWNTKYKENKKIGKYICKKATTTYRGTPIEAFYTTEIPISTGPYVFYGLPGLILELKTIGQINQSWKVKNIQMPYKQTVLYNAKYINSLPKITLKNLVKKIDDQNTLEQEIFFSKLNLPNGERPTVTTISGNIRAMLETKFEWEK